MTTEVERAKALAHRLIDENDGFVLFAVKAGETEDEPIKCLSVYAGTPVQVLTATGEGLLDLRDKNNELFEQLILGVQERVKETTVQG